MSPSVRPALLSDAAAIAALGARVFTATYAHSVERDQLDAFLKESYTPAAVILDINNSATSILVAVDEDGRPAGFAYLTGKSTDPCVANVKHKVELQRLYVDPSVQGKRIGRLLATEAEDLARAQGFTHMWLGVWEENVKAIRIYEKWGFRRMGEHDFHIGSVVQTDLIMLKSLEQ